MNKLSELKLEGAVCINKVTSNVSCPRPVRITVADVTSGVRVIEIAMSLEDFALALFAHGNMSATYTVYPRALSLLGMKAENKSMLVPFGEVDPCNMSDEDAITLLAPYETDGWKASFADYKNHHNRSKAKDGGWQARIAFFRHIDPETEEPVVQKEEAL